MDVDRVIKIAKGAKGLGNVKDVPVFSPKKQIATRLGVIRDKSFTFYYEDNLDAFAAAGAEINISTQ